MGLPSTGFATSVTEVIGLGTLFAPPTCRPLPSPWLVVNAWERAGSAGERLGPTAVLVVNVSMVRPIGALPDPIALEDELSSG